MSTIQLLEKENNEQKGKKESLNKEFGRNGNVFFVTYSIDGIVSKWDYFPLSYFLFWWTITNNNDNRLYSPVQSLSHVVHLLWLLLSNFFLYLFRWLKLIFLQLETNRKWMNLWVEERMREKNKVVESFSR